MTFSREHFNLIAEIIKMSEEDGGNNETREGIARRFADRLERENPRFDRSKFLSACNVGE